MKTYKKDIEDAIRFYSFYAPKEDAVMVAEGYKTLIRLIVEKILDKHCR